eukprot:14928179-Alexandrium_andersonii.AAC.1
MSASLVGSEMCIRDRLVHSECRRGPRGGPQGVVCVLAPPRWLVLSASEHIQGCCLDVELEDTCAAA